METLSYSVFRSQLSSALDKVSDHHVPIMITRQNGKSVVLISLDDFQSYGEMELQLALYQSQQDLAANRFTLDSIDAHASEIFGE
jgi:antitoxin YefM